MFRVLFAAALLAVPLGCGCPDYARAPGALELTVVDTAGNAVEAFSGTVLLAEPGSTQTPKNVTCPGNGCAQNVFTLGQAPQPGDVLTVDLKSADAKLAFQGEVAFEVSEDSVDGPWCSPARNGKATVTLK